MLSRRWEGAGGDSSSNSGEARSPSPGPPAALRGGADRGGLRAAKDEGRAALMPYMMAGYPDRETSLAVAEAYADAGADLVELGVPFSDPLADGPTIHAAATAALGGGGDAGDARWRSARRSRSGSRSSSWSTRTWCWRMGARLSSRGVRLPPGPPGRSFPTCRWRRPSRCARRFADAGLALVPLVAPTTPAERRARICAAAQGFVYVVSTVGTTGERDELPPELAELVAATKAEAEVPVAVGFGIGTPEQAAEVGEVADGVIIGSRLVRAAGEAGAAGGRRRGGRRLPARDAALAARPLD